MEVELSWYEQQSRRSHLEKWLLGSPLRNANKHWGRFIGSVTGNTAASRQTLRTNQIIATQDFFGCVCLMQYPVLQSPAALKWSLRNNKKMSVCALDCQPSNHLSLFSCNLCWVATSFCFNPNFCFFSPISCEELIHLNGCTQPASVQIPSVHDLFSAEIWCHTVLMPWKLIHVLSIS